MKVEKLTGLDVLNIYNILFNLDTGDAKLQYLLYKVLSTLEVEYKAIESSKSTILKKYKGNTLPDGRIFFDGDNDVTLRNQASYAQEEKEILDSEYEVNLELDEKYFTVNNFIKHLDKVGKVLKLSKILVDNEDIQ